jgi:protein SCO1
LIDRRFRNCVPAGSAGDLVAGCFSTERRRNSINRKAMNKYSPALLTTLLLFLPGCAKKPLPVMGEIPQFELTNQQGHNFDRTQLDGRVWVADFIFTNCESSCPRMSSKMHQLQGATDREVQLVSFSVDPERDTPPALTEYGKKYSADPSRWTFLTGNPKVLDMLDHDAFKLGNLNMDHSTRFVLIDKKGRVRGYYGLFDGDPVSKLAKDAARLESEPA